MTFSLDPAHYVVAATVKSSAIEIVTIYLICTWFQAGLKSETKTSCVP